MRKRHLIIWSIILIVTLVVLPASAVAGKKKYISLGTSLAAGETSINPLTLELSPLYCGEEGEWVISPTPYSYTDKLAEETSLKHKKLGCTGETVQSFMTGEGSNCYNPRKSQFRRAKKIIRKKKNIELITIDLGANDVLWCFFDPRVVDITQCVIDQSSYVAANLMNIIAELKDTMNAVDKEIPIIGMNYYNPILAADLSTQPLLAIFNNALESVYLNPIFDNVYLADVALAFNSDRDEEEFFRYFPPLGGYIPLNLYEIYVLTLMGTCQNIHPNDAGYWRIADAFIDVILEKELLDDWDDDDRDDCDDD